MMTKIPSVSFPNVPFQDFLTYSEHPRFDYAMRLYAHILILINKRHSHSSELLKPISPEHESAPLDRMSKGASDFYNPEPLKEQRYSLDDNQPQIIHIDVFADAQIIHIDVFAAGGFLVPMNIQIFSTYFCMSWGFNDLSELFWNPEHPDNAGLFDDVFSSFYFQFPEFNGTDLSDEWVYFPLSRLPVFTIPCSEFQGLRHVS